MMKCRAAQVPVAAFILGAAIWSARPSTGYATFVTDAQPHAKPAGINDSVLVRDAWARPALKGGTGGAYMTITNNSRGVIRIVSATSTIAAATELHVSSVHNGMAHMEMLPNLLITPGASTFLMPGGMHFMLVGLRQAMVQGDSVSLTLRLQNGGAIMVNVAVRVQ